MIQKVSDVLILDANTLIDFVKADRTIIKLICSNVGKICLATPVLEEVTQICESDCVELGITLIEPNVEQLITASMELGPLSFQDKICLTLAKEKGLICVTNDIPLRKVCLSEGVTLIWGIELICKLVDAGGLPVKHAKEIISQIQLNNPKYITKTIVENAFSILYKR